MAAAVDTRTIPWDWYTDPAVLRLVSRECEAAHLHGRDVAVCGSHAMDEAAIPVLLGLGVHELSVAYAAVPAVKACVASLEFEACRALAQRALGCESADEVRNLAAASPLTSAHQNLNAVPQT